MENLAKQLQVNLLFRKPFKGSHSIEELFFTIIKNLPKNIIPVKKIMPMESKGLIGRLVNIFTAFTMQGEVTHITGDIHYIAFFLSKKKTILTIHDLEIIKRNHSFNKVILLLFWFYIPCKRVEVITVISEFTKQELLKYVKVKPEKIKVIPNCISSKLIFEQKFFNENYPVLLQIGTKHNKNIPSLIRSLENIPCKLIILGRLTEEQLNLLIRFKIDYENVYELPYNKVIELYQKADMLTYVSTYEGFGLPILEAQAIGRVVITSNVSSMPEVSADSALCVDPFDVQSIRQGILKLIQDADFREALIKKGCENVKRFSPDIIAKQYANLYWKVYQNK